MIILKKVFAIFALSFSFIPQHAFAETYYVDALNGNDGWSGKLESPSGLTDGPWQSLKKISDSTFQPGDAILFKCGQTWFETLRLKSNGTAANPITVSSYPAACENKPAIEGTITIPVKSWSNAGGNIYAAQLPVDLLATIPLDTSISGWKVWSPNRDATLSSSSGCDDYAPSCLTATSGATGSPSIVSSYTFAVNSSAPYLLRFAVKVPLGIKYRVTIRRSLPPWDAIGFNKVMVGTGQWATHALPFTATTSVKTARLDFEIPSGRIPFAMSDPHIEFQNGPVLGAYVDGEALPVAHHPNVGHDPQFPDSVYFKIGANSSADIGGSSNYLKIDSDLNFPGGGEITPGQTVHIRSASWRLDDRKITSFDGETIFFDEPSRYSPLKGYGYYLTGSLWMLDEPGEWYYDTSKQRFHVWMPDGQAPGKRISLSVLATGIDLNARSNVVIDGLAIRRTGVGILMVNSAGITVRNTLISDTAREGFDITGASVGTIHANRIAKTGRDAISHKGRPTGMTITDNVVSQSAVTTLPNGQRSLPVHSVQAIPSGINGTVSGNLITQTAYTGIYVHRGSRVFKNVVQESCLQLDDCGGIYTYGADNNSTVSGNLIMNLAGNANGTPRDIHTVGIYLDEPSSGNTVTGNTIAFAQYGIHLHNAYNNLIENNTIFGNRIYQLWLQESTNQMQPNGDIYGNKIYSNRIFPTGTSLGASHDTIYSTTANFATYDLNLYSTLTTRYVSREKWASGDILHTFGLWQAATDNGMARNLDPNGREIAQIGYTSFEVAGPNMIRNGDFSMQPLQWQAWNELKPSAQINVESDGTRYWLKLVAGGSYSLVASQNLSVSEGQWYRLTFDMKTGKDNQRVVIAPRRGGGGDNGYELITDAEHPVYGSTTWKRYNVLFKANKTVNYHDPDTRDWGARIDFQHVRPGDYIELARVELVPLRSVGITFREALLSNPTGTETAVDCPDSDLAAEACPYYVRFSDGQPITWPYDLPALGSEVIYTRNDSLVDTDSDGIADQQDSCPETPIANPTNSQGCALGQDPRS